MKEYRASPAEVHKEASAYGGFTVLNEKGERSLSVSCGPRGIVCKVCSELPDWCEDTDKCAESWKDRATKAEKKFTSIANQLQDMSLDISW